MSKFKNEVVDINRLKTDSKTSPPLDPVFQHLFEEAYSGRIPVYIAAIPLEIIRPYSPDYNPEGHPEGEKVTEALFEDWRNGSPTPMWVYPKGNYFIMADDYPVFAAAQKAQAEYVPCLVIGYPSSSGAKNISGPLKQEEIFSHLGIIISQNR